MVSDNNIHSEVSTEVEERLPPDSNEETNNMVSRAAAKPTVEYQGYQRTITDVIRIRQQNGEREDHKTGVSQLMIGIDDAIKTCRNLRQRLERLHQRRNTGFYQHLTEPVTSSQ